MFLKAAMFAKTAIPAVEKSLDAAMLRSRAIANNLANLTTPGYQRIEVAFEDKLKEAMDMKRLAGTADKPGHMRLGRPDLENVHAVAYRSQDPTLPGDVNNVDVDMEAAKLAENEILYMYGIKFMKELKGNIHSAITGHGG